MKYYLFTLVGLIFLLNEPAYSQSSAHGPSIKSGYSSLEKHSFGVGYLFLTFKDSWGWVRPSHNYYIEYIPEFNALGASANIQSVFLIGKAGFETSFRSNFMETTFFTVFPHIGFDLINFDISFGPEFISTPMDNKSMGFKVYLKVHPKLFNRGSNKIILNRTLNRKN